MQFLLSIALIADLALTLAEPFLHLGQAWFGGNHVMQLGLFLGIAVLLGQLYETFKR